MPQDQAPWLKYQSSASDGPWTKYQSAPSDTTPAPVAPIPEQPKVGSIMETVKHAPGAGIISSFANTLASAPHALGQLLSPSEQPGDRVNGVQLPYVPTVLKRAVVNPSMDQLQKASDSYGMMQHAPSSSDKVGFGTEAVGHVLGAIPFIGPVVASVGERAGTGDIQGAAGEGLADAAMTAAGAKANELVGRGINAGINKIAGPQPIDPTKPISNLPEVPKYASKLAKVHGGETSYELRNKLENDVIPSVANDLKQSEKDVFNRPVKTTEEHFNVVKNAAQRIWDEYKPYLAQGSTINGDDVVKRAMDNYDPAVKANNPKAYENFVKKITDAFGNQNISPEDAQRRLTQLNAEAQGFYASNNAQDMAAKSKLKGAQPYLATGDALRAELDAHLPEGASDVRKRYGNIAELMADMPMPSEAGKPFLKALFSNTAKAMSTRPGYAMARGAMRAAGMEGTDALVRKAYADMPYKGNPTTAPTSQITNPLTGQTQTVPRGPNAIVPQVQPVQNPHPMNPRAVLQGRNPLEIPPNPLETPQVNTGLPLDANHIQASQPLANVPAQLSNINQRVAPLPVETGLSGAGSRPTPLPTPLETLQNHAPLPQENQVNPISSSTPGHPMRAIPQVRTALPEQTPLTHSLYSTPAEQVGQAPLGVAGERTGAYPQGQAQRGNAPRFNTPKSVQELMGQPTQASPPTGLPPVTPQQGPNVPRGGNSAPSVQQYMGTSADVTYAPPQSPQPSALGPGVRTGIENIDPEKVRTGKYEQLPLPLQRTLRGIGKRIGNTR